MSVTCRFPYALLQQIQDDLATLTRTVHTLQTQSDSDAVLLQSLQSTVDSIVAVLSSAETPTPNVFLHPTFTDCVVGTLSYLDDDGNPHDLETTLDSKLTVGIKVAPAFSIQRKITLGCDMINSSYINFNSNDRDTDYILCMIVAFFHRVVPVELQEVARSLCAVKPPLSRVMWMLPRTTCLVKLSV